MIFGIILNDCALKSSMTLGSNKELIEFDMKVGLASMNYDKQIANIYIYAVLVFWDL